MSSTLICQAQNESSKFFFQDNQEDSTSSSKLIEMLFMSNQTKTSPSNLLHVDRDASLNRSFNFLIENYSMIMLNSTNIYTKLNELSINLIYKLRFMFYFVWPSETMFSSLDQVPRYVTEMFPIFVFIIIVENIIRFWQGKSTLRLNETVGSLGQGIFQECLRIKVRSIEVLMYCLIYENYRLLTLPWNSLYTWWLCYLAVDLGFYFAHRMAHEINFIWAIHQAHHSSEEFSVVSALRQAVLQPFTSWFTYVPLALVGIPPQVFLPHLQLSELYMAWLHTEVVDTIGPLEYILNTPSHHRVHHSRNPDYIDKNYGGMLIIWDRLFGTFKAEDKLENPPVYGLVHQVKGFNPIWVQFHPWPVIFRRIIKEPKLSDKMGILFKGPGWRPGIENRLGNPDEIPKIKLPVEYYDPQLSFWLNSYILIHFSILILFYHELTLYHNTFSPLITNIGVISLLASITTLAILLDNKRRNGNFYELSRCCLFFVARHKINYIITHGFERAGLPIELVSYLTSGIHLLFGASIMINVLILLSRYIQATNRYPPPTPITSSIISKHSKAA